MRDFTGTLRDVRDAVSTLSEDYHKTAAVSEMRGVIRRVRRDADRVDDARGSVGFALGSVERLVEHFSDAHATVEEVVGAVDEAAEILDDGQAGLLQVAQSLLAQADMLELRSRQMDADERQMMEDEFLSRIEAVLERLIESIEDEIAEAEEDGNEDELGESCDGYPHECVECADYNECYEGCDEDYEFGPSDEDLFEEYDNDPSSMSLDVFLDGLVYDVMSEADVSESTALDVLGSAVFGMVDEGIIEDIPGEGADPTEAGLWVYHAIQEDLPGLVMQLARGVDSE